MTTLSHAYVPPRGNPNRITNDFYPTPPIATLSLLRNHEVPRRIWEPAAGRGHVSKELVRNGHEVVSTDLFEYPDPLVPITTGVDFTACDVVECEGIVTNPPFRGNLPEKLLRRALEVYRIPFVALLCRLTFLESARRYDLFDEHPPARVYVFSERINCHQDYLDRDDGLGGMMAYAWFVWDDRYNITKNTVAWIRPSDYVKDL